MAKADIAAVMRSHLPPRAASAFWAHIGGFVMGAVLILPFLRRPARPAPGRVVPLYDTADD